MLRILKQTRAKVRNIKKDPKIRKLLFAFGKTWNFVHFSHYPVDKG